MKRYTEYSAEEKLALSNDELFEAIKIEAIEREIAPPIELSEVLKQTEYSGFSYSPGTTLVYEILVQGSYNQERTGLAFLTEEEAKKAILGGLSVKEDGYGPTKCNKLMGGEISYRATAVGGQKAEFFQSKLEKLVQDNEAFNKVSDECMDDLSSIRQRKYDKQVNSEKRASYLALAKGDVEIARAFWNKAERTEFPSE